jgi:NTP pyrophosphatase (non-canonical NTP hydrolase)
MADFEDVVAKIRKFRDDRNWAQFHSPKNLAAAVSIESGELQETMLWKSDDEIQKALQNKDQKERMAEEVADILILSLLFCDAIEIDPINAIDEKLKRNAEKYPVELSRNKSSKYSELS